MYFRQKQNCPSYWFSHFVRRINGSIYNKLSCMV